MSQPVIHGSTSCHAETNAPPYRDFLIAEARDDDSEKPLTMHSRVFAFDRLPVNSSGGKTTIRTVLQGKLPTGESVEIHETALMPGQMPHAPHKHRHTEFLFIREGNLEFIFGDRTEPLWSRRSRLRGFERDAWLEECGKQYG